MTDLFGNKMKPTKVYQRDSIGRFANEKTAKFERALTDAAKYKQMFLAAQSRMKGMANMLRMKEELISKMKNNG